MANYNRVLLMGRLTRDIELKHIPSGLAVAELSLAVNDRKKKNEETGEWEDGRAHFIDCEAWGRTAEVMHKYLSKGKPVFIEGRLKLDTWQDKEGSNRSKLRVVIESFEFIDSGGGGGGGAGGAGGGGQPAYSGSGQSSPGQQHQPIAEDDIPF